MMILNNGIRVNRNSESRFNLLMSSIEREKSRVERRKEIAIENEIEKIIKLTLDREKGI